MLRPLIVDLLGLALPLVLGTFLYFAGRRWHGWPWLVRAAVLVVSLGLVTGSVLMWFVPPPDALAAALSAWGGATVLMALVSLFLLGIVWSVPNRSFSSPFLVILAGVAGVLILIEAGGSLWWRFGATDTWQRHASSAGLLQQSSGATCSPTAAVMLLAHHGIDSSEGEMAYLAGTSMLGTDAHAVARALQTRAQPHGLEALVGRPSYEQAREWVPFVAHVRGEQGGHALLVEHLDEHQVRLADPADGRRHQVPAAEFQRIWDGTAIRLVDR